MKWMQRSIVALLVAGALALGLAGPAAAQQDQDGLVNVVVEDITILQDVNIAVAARVVALICDTQVGPIVVLGRAVDRGDIIVTPEDPVCEADGAPIIIEQN